ncbi:MAG: hypothetical protein IZT56_09330 [Bacteroidetes bacterium]|jgi:hypothetical protein|nr:hypothetical protein [Bacteroidota bacterium]
MGAKNLNEKVEEYSNLKLMKNNRTIEKLLINTVIPKFTFKNNKGEIVKPKTGVSF